MQEQQYYCTFYSTYHPFMNQTAKKQKQQSKSRTQEGRDYIVQSYPNSNNLKKLEIIDSLYSDLQTKEGIIQTLEKKVSDLQLQNQKRLAQAHTSQKIDSMSQKTKKASLIQVEQLIKQNDNLNTQVRELKGKLSKMNITAQKQQASKLFDDFEIKINGQIETQSLKSRINALLAQKQKQLSEWRNEQQKYSQSKESFSRNIQEIKLEQKNQQKNNLNLNAELTRLKETESKLLKEMEQMKKELNSQRQVKSLFFDSCKQLLGSITILKDSDKYNGFLNTLRAQDLITNDKKAKIKSFIAANNQNINILNRQLNKSKEQIDRVVQSSSQQEVRIKQLSTALQNEISIKKATIEQNQKLSKTIEENNKQISLLKLNFSQVSQKKTSLQIQIEDFKEKINTSKATIKSQQLQITKCQNQYKELNSRFDFLSLKKTELDKKKSDLEETISNLKRQLKNCDATNSSQLKQINRLEQQTKVLNKQTNQLTRQLQQKNVRMNQLQQSLRIQIQKTLNLTNNLNNANSSIDNLKKVQRELSQRVRDLQSILDKVNQSLIGETSHCFLGQTLSIQPGSFSNLRKFKEESETLLRLWKESYKSVKFFNGSEVVTKDGIDFILSTLEDYVGWAPVETRLIYKYDALNPTNFHSYLDRNENLISFIKLSNGTVIGGFSVYPIEQKNTIKPGKGFLFNMTYKKAYQLRNEPRLPVVSFDRYYYLFGNAEIRLRSQEKKVFSNFGIASSTFDNANDTRAKFLGISETASNEQEIETYEFYQIIFK